MSIELLTHLKEERQKLDQAVAGLSGEQRGSVQGMLSAMSARFSAVASEIDGIVRGKPAGVPVPPAAPSNLPFEKLQAEMNKSWEGLFEILLDLPRAHWQKPEIARPVQALTDEIRAEREKIATSKKPA